jgi:hypothetical protein
MFNLFKKSHRKLNIVLDIVIMLVHVVVAM